MGDGNMERYFTTEPLIDAIIPAAAALVCGLALGAERETNRHAAGLRTLALIALGSCLFTMAGRWLAEFPIATGGAGSQWVVDPGRLASYVIAGIGFLGAGPIITRTATTEGLTTAASIWSTAAIGVLAGFGYVQTAIAATIVILIVLWGLRSLASRLRGDPHRRGTVVLAIADHLALVRVRLLLDKNPLVEALDERMQGDQWRLHLTFCGDEMMVTNLLEAVAGLPGVRGIAPAEYTQVEAGIVAAG